MLLVPVPGADGLVAAGGLEPGRDFGAWLDRMVLGAHLWAQCADLGSGRHRRHAARDGQPAASACLPGQYLASPAGRVRKSSGPALAGAVLSRARGWMGRSLMPINKNLWTPSYVRVHGRMVARVPRGLPCGDG